MQIKSRIESRSNPKVIWARGLSERKNRQTARSEGSYVKDINAQKEAAKKKKQKIRLYGPNILRSCRNLILIMP